MRRALLAAALLLAGLAASPAQEGFPVGTQAGSVNGALKGNGSGVVSQAACADLSNGATGCSTNYTATTWTPAFVGSSTPGTGQAYSIQVGSYEQVGRQVTVRFFLVATSLGTAAGNLQVNGLPVASANTANDYGVCSTGFHAVAGLASLSYGLVGNIAPNTSTILIYQNASTGNTALTVAQAGGSVQILMTCSYHT